MKCRPSVHAEQHDQGAAFSGG